METGAAKLLKGPRACVTCARSKSRCVPGPAGQEKCERCHRLVKPCSSQAPAAPRKRKEPRSRVAEIERRLEDLMARIESGQALAPAAPSPPDSEPRGAPTFSRAPWDPPFEQVSFPVHPVPPPPPPALPSAPYQHPSSSRPQQRQEQGCAWPQGDEAEALLDEYKTHLAHRFPFVIVPPNMSSAQLREQKPVLWKAVMLEACLFDGPRQIALGKKLLGDILDAAFIRPENSLDLLQGLQLLIAWYHYHLNNFQMANLLFLARSITISLGSAKLKDLSDKGGNDSDSLEQMRAFVGTYYLVTITFTTNKRPDALMSTSYLTTCCRALHSRMEYPTDELVVHLVRAQQLAQGVSQGCARRNAGPAEKQTPLAPFIRALRDRIQAFAASLPPHIRADPTLAGHLQVAEVLVYENSLEELACCPMCGVRAAGAASTAATAATEATADPEERIELLRACVRVLQSFMAIRFAHEIGEYPRFICPSAFDVTYVFLTTLKLVILQVPGWDGKRAREELQFDGFVDRLLEMLERAAERRWKKRKEGVAGGDGKPGEVEEEEETEDVYAKLARKIRKVKEHLLTTGLDSEYATSQMARVCDPPPMTLADATQDLMQDLGAGLWQDDMGAVPDWSPFLMGDAFDWTAAFSTYAVPEFGYAA